MCSSSNTSESSTPTVNLTSSDTGNTVACCFKDSRNTAYQQVTLGTLPDDVLLEIFDFYVDETDEYDEWHTLVHVCRRWRNVVFSSPRRLDLRLVCTARRSAMQMLDIWPALPIIVFPSRTASLQETDDNIIAALTHHDRVREISLECTSSLQFQRFVEAMQGPFLELTSLKLNLGPRREPTPVLPESFLGGFAPRLRQLEIIGVAFPQLRKLLVSANDIVELHLLNIPHSGYISPQAMVICLSSLGKLKSLELGFRSPQSRPNRERPRPPPLTRTILPSLITFSFQGVSEYVEDFVSRIDAPLLSGFELLFFHQLIFDQSQLAQFISRTETFKALSRIDVNFCQTLVRVILSLPTGTKGRPLVIFTILCSESDWQVSSVEQVCGSLLPPLPNLERLDIRVDRRWAGCYNWPDDMIEQPRLQSDMDNSQWLELLHSFATVKNLYLSEELAQHVAPALQELSEESVIEVLPALQNLSLEGFQTSESVQEAIGKFVAKRQLANRPVAVHGWERDNDSGDIDD